MGIQKAENLWALVDMGSNGIRFSISDLSPPTARNIPTLYQDRAAISLYDVQYSSGPKTPIPVETIQNICASLLKFKCTCEDFEVPQKNIRVLATEATRDAINSVEFRRQIIEATGWEVDMLPKVEEGRIGAMGVASSFRSIDGLVMDLGGGSTQITYLQTRRGEVHFGSGGSVSLPFGAAALLRRMNAASQHGMRAMAALKKEVQESLLAAYRSLEVPEEVERNGLSLFLSGGGFRGWGYVLMDKHVVNPYPIPIINGFSVKPDMFQDVVSVESHIVAQGGTMLGVSQRRATQVPAVAFLISALTEALPEIKEVRFCQGGVREGALFSSLPPSIRNQSPLDTATLAYAPPSSKSLSVLLSAAVPSPCPPILSSIFLATVHLLYFHGPLPAENRAAAALRCTTSGLLAGVHGLLHEERTALALLLCERWGGEIPVTDAVFHENLRKLAGPEVEWWMKYVGRIAEFVGEVYPAGVVGTERIRLSSEISAGGRLELRIQFLDKDLATSIYAKTIKKIEKVGKKKNWIGGREGWGLQVDVTVTGTVS